MQGTQLYVLRSLSAVPHSLKNIKKFVTFPQEIFNFSKGRHVSLVVSKRILNTEA